MMALYGFIHYTNNTLDMIHCLKYRVTQTLVNLKQSLVLNGTFRFKPTSQFVERYQSVMGCALNMEELISKIFGKFNK
jgi:hypothetical protein